MTAVAGWPKPANAASDGTTPVTDVNGNFLFEEYPEGSYIVVVDTSDPDFPTAATPTGDPDLNTGTIGDFIFFDEDGDGVQDAGEGGPLVFGGRAGCDRAGDVGGAVRVLATGIDQIEGVRGERSVARLGHPVVGQELAGAAHRALGLRAAPAGQAGVMPGT